MTPINPPSYLSNVLLPASTDRMNLGALLAPDVASGVLRNRGGVLLHGSASGWAVKQQASGTMNVLVPAASFVIPSSTGGVYLAHNDADYAVALAASAPSTTRHDLIVARMYDQDISGASNLFALEPVQGTAGGGLPALPTNAIPLADVTVGAGVTSIVNANIAALHKFTVAPGGILPAKTADLPAIANQYAGDPTFDLTTLLLGIYDGTARRQIPHESAWGAFPKQVSTGSPGTGVSIMAVGSLLIAFGSVSLNYSSGTASRQVTTGMSTVSGAVCSAEITNNTAVIATPVNMNSPAGTFTFYAQLTGASASSQSGWWFAWGS
jgi:hypothetical protein